MLLFQSTTDIGVQRPPLCNDFQKYTGELQEYSLRSLLPLCFKSVPIAWSLYDITFCKISYQTVNTRVSREFKGPKIIPLFWLILESTNFISYFYCIVSKSAACKKIFLCLSFFCHVYNTFLDAKKCLLIFTPTTRQRQNMVMLYSYVIFFVL